MSEWLPISTAPKDGKPFLTARFEDGFPNEYEVCRYEPFYFPEYVAAEDGLFRVEQRLFSEWHSSNFRRATHWAPIPGVKHD